jgi:hypothetical protein
MSKGDDGTTGTFSYTRKGGSNTTYQVITRPPDPVLIQRPAPAQPAGESKPNK